MKQIYLAGGCFWGLEKYLSLIRGVVSTQAGYANGRTQSPTYEDVCSRDTGHAETVRVEYDPELLPLGFLLSLFSQAIDPVSVNRQGNDVGAQYRTGIYYEDAGDLPVIQAFLDKLQKEHDLPVAIEVSPLEHFFPAEEYHQKYLDKNPYGYCHIGAAQFHKAAHAVVDPDNYPLPRPEELQESLTPEQFAVTQNAATEPPFRNAYHNHFKPGIYVDITTGEPLFTSDDKFESGCGWPSFSKPIDPYVLRELGDTSYGMVRTEVRSRSGRAHLGHVFEDGPQETGGLRYCINSAALRFIPREEMEREGYGYLLRFVK